MLTFLVIFVIFWWLILFIILPTGINKQKNVKFGNDPGAPNDPMLKKKFLIDKNTPYSTVTDLARFLGLSISYPLSNAE